MNKAVALLSVLNAIAVPSGLFMWLWMHERYSVDAPIACYASLIFPLGCFVCSSWAPSLAVRRPETALFLSLLPARTAIAFFGLGCGQ